MYSLHMASLAEVVKNARKRRRLTQEALADAVGKSVSWVGMLETEKLDRPKNTELHSLSRALQVPVEDLLVAMGQLEEPAEDPALLLQRIAALPTAEERLGAVEALPEPVFRALAILSNDLVAAKSQQLAELVRRLGHDPRP